MNDAVAKVNRLAYKIATDFDASKDIAALIEALQDLDYEMERMQDDPPAYNESVTVEIDGQKIRFPNLNAYTDFIMGVMSNGK